MNYPRSEPQNHIQIPIKWAVTIVVGAILTGLVGGGFTVASVLNSDHFVTAQNQRDIDEIKENYVTKEQMVLVLYGINELLIDHGLQPIIK